jgi:molecular chaperone GrpE (heat shock protein)
MTPLDPPSLERLAALHTEAWERLWASTAAVASLPLRTVQHLAGWPETAGPTAAERLAQAEDGRRTLAAALRDAQAAHRADRVRFEARLAEAQALVDDLRQAFFNLEREATERETLAREDQKLALYQTLEPLLTQVPLVRHALGEGREVAAEDVLALLAPLDQALAELGFEAIGQVGQPMPFDPACHHVTRGAMPEAGAPVTVKHVGYRLGDRILRRARVSQPSN